MPYVFDYIRTGREPVNSGPAGVKVTNGVTNNTAECTLYDKVIENMQSALKLLESYDNPEPKTVQFKYYLHEGSHFDGLEWSLGEAGVKLTEELYEKIGRPFYEVTLLCELDLTTGEVSLIEASL